MIAIKIAWTYHNLLHGYELALCMMEVSSSVFLVSNMLDFGTRVLLLHHPVQNR
jgi:hypothetical protein